MVLNLACYAFFDIEDPEAAKRGVEELLLGTGTVGSILIAPEGVNLNLAGPFESSSEIPKLEATLSAWLLSLGAAQGDLHFKRSVSKLRPFKRFKVKVKQEIITMGVDDLNVKKWRAPHMSSEDFAKLISKKSSKYLILDTRNDFEVGVGTFQGATPAGMKSFTEFPTVAMRLAKDRPIVMFCTGGIRCEKASAYLRQQGFKEVQQLEGGILGYFERQGRKGFHGSCFVFDERMSLDAASVSSENGSVDTNGDLSLDRDHSTDRSAQAENHI